MFGTLQGRLPQELSLAGISDIDEANRYIREVYLPMHNEQFAKPPQIAEESALWRYPIRQASPTSCASSRNASSPATNTVTYEGHCLQLPNSPARAHYVKARVKIREYPDGRLAVFYGPRCLARYSPHGEYIATVPTTQSVTPCLPPSRTLRTAEGGGLRPSLTAAPRGVTAPRQVGTKKRPADRTKKLTIKEAAQIASISP